MRRLRARAASWLRASTGVFLCGCFVTSLPAVAAEAIEAGQRIYRAGILPSGQPLRATVGNDVAFSGAHAACINCHRRSGYGGAEGKRVVPPIIVAYLFGAPPAGAEGSPPKLAYDKISLKRALLEGRHFTGRPLSGLMPRYALSDADFDALYAYLKTLGSTPAPGVSNSEIHFATIVTEGVGAQQRQALLGVMHAFVEQQNAERRTPKKKDRRIPFDHSRVYRATQQWRFHVWELKGAPDTWPRQMDRYYRAQPVYAVLGGVGRGSWQPIQAHCERLALACLFPNIDHVEAAEQYFFSMHFTRGVSQEAEILARTLLERHSAEPRRLVQVYRAHDSGKHAADALRRALSGAPGFQIEEYVLSDNDSADAGFWSGLRSGQQDICVLWLRSDDLAQFAADSLPGASFYVSDTLLDDPGQALPEPLRTRTAVLRLRELPVPWHDRRARIESWLKSHGQSLSDERIQNNTYHMLSLVSRVITHNRDNFSREYLIESIEHLAQTSAWPSSYPRFSLAPGQRLASPGGYRLQLNADGSLPAQSEWIVPDAGRSK